MLIFFLFICVGELQNVTEYNFSESVKTAQERSKDVLQKRQEEAKKEANTTEENVTPKLSGETREEKRDRKNGAENEDDVGPPLPPGFDVGPAIPAGFKIPDMKGADDAENSSDDEDEEEEEDPNQMTLPISSSINLLHGKKPIAALALDPSGARLLTGGDDYNLKFWDFPGMTQTLEPFRYMEPQEGYHIRDLAYSVTGDNILVTTGSATPTLYDRDGFLVATCAKGSNFDLLKNN